MKSGSEIVRLINNDTRRTVQMLRQQQTRGSGSDRLAFEKTGYRLKLKP